MAVLVACQGLSLAPWLGGLSWPLVDRSGGLPRSVPCSTALWSSWCRWWPSLYRIVTIFRGRQNPINSRPPRFQSPAGFPPFPGPSLIPPRPSPRPSPRGLWTGGCIRLLYGAKIGGGKSTSPHIEKLPPPFFKSLSRTWGCSDSFCAKVGLFSDFPDFGAKMGPHKKAIAGKRGF